MSFLIDCEYVISSEVVQIEAHMNMHLNSFGTTKVNIFVYKIMSLQFF